MTDNLQAPSIVDRVQWLARPWFFVAIALLALNGHVFKAAWPGLVTGKLSDVAGLVVVATLASVLLGAGWGTVSAGLAFTALKTVPGVAEVVAPFIGGGVTLRDATDLVALLALPPLWFVLARPRADQRARNRQGWAAIALIAAAFATAADSSSQPRHASLDSRDGVIYASVDPGYGFDWTVLASQDGGRTWPPAPFGSRGEIDAARWEVEKPDGFSQVCAADGTCYRLRYEDEPDYQGGVVERSEDAITWQRDGLLSFGFLEDLAVDPTNSDRVVVLEGDKTVRFRRAAGDWGERDLGPMVQLSLWQVRAATTFGTPGGSVAFCVLVEVLIWRIVPWKGVQRVFQVINLIALCYLCLSAFLTQPADILMSNLIWLGIVAVLVALMRLSWWSERRSLSRSEGVPPPMEDRR